MICESTKADTTSKSFGSVVIRTMFVLLNLYVFLGKIEHTITFILQAIYVVYDPKVAFYIIAFNHMCCYGACQPIMTSFI